MAATEWNSHRWFQWPELPVTGRPSGTAVGPNRLGGGLLRDASP
jgi:hypothetical protein